MIKKKHFIIFLILFCNAVCYTQISNEVSDQKIINLRKDILNAVEKYNQPEINFNFEKILALETENQHLLWLNEKWLLNYYTENYTNILNDLLIYDSLINFQHFISMPLYDDLMKFLPLMANNDKDSILTKLYKSGYSSEEKDFFILLFQFLLNTEDRILVSQDSINMKVQDFQDRWPNSPYIEFLITKIKKEYVKSNFTYNLDLFTGLCLPLGNLDTYFTHSGCYGFDTEVRFKKLGLGISFILGMDQQIKTEFDYNYCTWQQNTTVNYFIPVFNLSYLLLSSDNNEFITFIGCGLSNYYQSPNTLKTNNIIEKIGPAQSVLLGIRYNRYFSVAKYEEIDRIVNMRWKIGFKMEYIYPTFYKINNTLTGNFLLISISIGTTILSYNLVK